MCSGKAEAVEEPEGKGDNPGRAGGDASLSLACADNLGGNKSNRQRDRRLNRRRRHIDEAQRSRGERNAVRDSERGDRQDELARVRCDQDESKHEEEMIDAEHDVLDAEL